MQDIVFFYPEGHQNHAKPGHPERPERVEAIKTSLINADLWDRYPKIPKNYPSEQVLKAIHRPAYLSLLNEACQNQRQIDFDTYITGDSCQLALNTAGGAVETAKEVWNNNAKRGFAFTRPPGHHATPDRAMGFCLLNNIALAAENLIQNENAHRIAIVDIDLHHGNGTQDIFWERGDVLYLSTHQYPHYPGTGRINEMGSGEGENTTINIPLPPYSGDAAFRAIMHEIILPLLDRFNPEMVLVSAGMDIHWMDPLGQLLISVNGYAETISALAHWADQHCEGKIALFLEGGYDIDAGAACALAATQALIGHPWQDPMGPSPSKEEDFWEIVVENAQMLWRI
jgi:acetoin utilization deacetylase AcuC-like enzyme